MLSVITQTLLSPRFIILLILILSCILNFIGRMPQQNLFFVLLFLVGYLTIDFLLSTYLNFVMTVRNHTANPDNRSANFLTFDMFKFVLILVAFVVIVVLALNKVLNTETVAALIGGILGSLITLRASFRELK